MNSVTITFLLLLAGQGGITSMQVFFCKIPGCAANVRWVFCNNIDVYGRDHVDITDCKGHYPPLNSVCKHEDLAFVSTDMAGECEFESTNEYIPTESCRDHSDICDFSSGPPADIINNPDNNIKIVIGLKCLSFKS